MLRYTKPYKNIFRYSDIMVTLTCDNIMEICKYTNVSNFLQTNSTYASYMKNVDIRRAIHKHTKVAMPILSGNLYDIIICVSQCIMNRTFYIILTMLRRGIQDMYKLQECRTYDSVRSPDVKIPVNMLECNLMVGKARPCTDTKIPIHMLIQYICCMYMHTEDLIIMVKRIDMEHRLSCAEYGIIRSSSMYNDEDEINLFASLYLSDTGDACRLALDRLIPYFKRGMEDLLRDIRKEYKTAYKKWKVSFPCIGNVKDIQVTDECTIGDIMMSKGKMFSYTCKYKFVQERSMTRESCVNTVIIHLMRCNTSVDDMCRYMCSRDICGPNSILSAINSYSYVSVIARIGGRDERFKHCNWTILPPLDITLEQINAICTHTSASFAIYTMENLCTLNKIQGAVDKYIELYLYKHNQCMSFVVRLEYDSIVHNSQVFIKVLSHCIRVIHTHDKRIESIQTLNLTVASIIVRYIKYMMENGGHKHVDTDSDVYKILLYMSSLNHVNWRSWHSSIRVDSS